MQKNKDEPKNQKPIKKEDLPPVISDEKPAGPFFRFFFFLSKNGDDIFGILLLALGLMTVLGLVLPAFSGGILAKWIVFLKRYFGWGITWIIIGLITTGVWLIQLRRPESLPYKSNVDISMRTRKQPPWMRIFALEVAAFSSLALLSLLWGNSIERAEAGLDGGIVGWGIVSIVAMIFAPLGFAGKIWVGSLLLILFLWGIIYGAGLWNSFLRKTSAPPAKEDAITPEIPIQRKETRQESQKPRVSRTLLDTPSKPVPVTHTESIREEQEVDVEMKPRDERLPALTILSNEETNRPDERTINQTAGQIVRTLAEFGIPAEVIGYRIGPTVTQFAVRPGFIEKEKGQGEGEYQRLKVRVAQISSLEKDLSLSLSAERLRIEAPVPGRPYIGIEVPNNRTMAVRLRPVLESKIYEKLSSLPLAIALGKDVSGQPVVADLAKMPHLLIAGTTGSGKSVCIASIAVCLAMNNLPDSLRMVMIDPKMVELQRFKGLPHILGKVEIELDRILVVLRWIVAEMDRRYKLLEAAHARNIDSYNRKISQRKGEIALPRIVVFIDELADLMMSAPEETEHNLVRLAQMARAVGIHLVVATQRPSTEVVTGLIKANFPARIAFNVASSVDSRVILDTVGAEHLLGRGDMLFLPPDAPAPMRLQGVIITDQEIERLITFWIKHTTLATDSTSPPWEIMMEQEVLSDRDELIDKAIEILRGSKRASTSMLQRRLRIGFPRAARLMEELEEMGVVGPAQSAGRDREVLLE